MNEPHDINAKVVDSAERPKPWQFSLRTIFILTALCAVYFSIAAQFPPVLLVSLATVGLVLSFVLMQVVGTLLAFGVTLAFEMIFGCITIWTARIYGWLIRSGNPSHRE